MAANRLSDQEIEALQRQVAALTEKLGVSELKRTEAEENAVALSQAGMFQPNTAEEQPTGKTIGIRVCLNPHARNEKEHKWKVIEFPTYLYTVNLPDGAGLDLTTNGIPYFHGQTYELDPMTLADLKSRVARCWDHEESIHGKNENIFRKPTNVRVGTPGAAQLMQRAASLGVN